MGVKDGAFSPWIFFIKICTKRKRKERSEIVSFVYISGNHINIDIYQDSLTRYLNFFQWGASECCAPSFAQNFLSSK